MKFANILTKRAEYLKECMCIEIAAQPPQAGFNIQTAIGIV